MSEKLGLPDLTYEELEAVCEVAEQAARKYIFSRVPMNQIVDFDITVDVEGEGPLTVSVDVELFLSPLAKDVDVKRLTDEAVGEALQAAEGKLREFASCKSRK